MTSSSSAYRATRYASVAIFLASFAHFMFFVSGILLSDLQLDFASLYAAGIDLNHGADPYVNHVAENPEWWDSFDPLQTSRFLYPPLAGGLFQLLAFFPYAMAKELWTSFIIFCVILSVALQAQSINLQFNRWTWLYISACVLIFLPFLVEIERGQVDALCLVLLSLSLFFMIRPHPKRFLAGMLLAVATLFKLHCGLVLIYLLLKKEFKFTLGFAGMWVILALASVCLYGWQLQMKYLTVEMPRISTYACYGTESMRIDPLVIGINNQTSNVKFVNMHGSPYALDSMGISAFASIPFYTKVLLQSKFTFGTWALITAAFILLLVGMTELKIKRQGAKKETLMSQYIYWQLTFMAVLLSGPLTWLMNSVWLIPLIPLCFYFYAHLKCRHDTIGWTLIVVGLAISAFPDESSGQRDIPLTYLFCLMKPLVGNVFCFVGLMRLYFVLRTQNLDEDEPSVIQNPINMTQ